jgi:hypothetical protein
LLDRRRFVQRLNIADYLHFVHLVANYGGRRADGHRART